MKRAFEVLAGLFSYAKDYAFAAWDWCVGMVDEYPATSLTLWIVSVIITAMVF